MLIGNNTTCECGNYLLGCLSIWYLQLEHTIMSILPLSLERVPFSVFSLVSVEVRPVSKNCSCSWSAKAPDCPSLLLLSPLLADQYSTLLYEFGGVLYITLFSTLYVTISQHMRLLRLSECDWVSGFWTHQNLWHYGLLLHFLLPYFSPNQNCSWGFVVLSTDIWLVH